MGLQTWRKCYLLGTLLHIYNGVCSINQISVLLTEMNVYTMTFGLSPFVI